MWDEYECSILIDGWTIESIGVWWTCVFIAKQAQVSLSQLKIEPMCTQESISSIGWKSVFKRLEKIVCYKWWQIIILPIWQWRTCWRFLNLIFF